MGILGGLSGGVFVICYRRFSDLRMKVIDTWWKRFLEAQLVTFIMHSVTFVASLYSQPWSCKPRLSKDPTVYDDGQYIVPYVSSLVTFLCPDGYYNEVASLYGNDGATTLRLLFHLPRYNPLNGEKTFSNTALAMFAFPYILLQFLSFGLAIPSGEGVEELLAQTTMKA